MVSKYPLIICSLILFAFTNTTPGFCADENDDSIRNRYAEWSAKYGRTQKDSEQRKKRFQIYKENVEFIEAFNSVNKGYKLTDNKFADLTNVEFGEKYLGIKRRLNRVPLLDMQQNRDHSERAREMLEDDVPSKMDWRDEGAVTEVKDQGRCGACWAFAAVAAIEGATQINSGESPSLSVQELIDCDTKGNNEGCYGGYMTDAYDFITNNGGLTTESDYPYKAVQERCNTAKLGNYAATIKGYRNVTADEKSLKRAVASRPVSVGIDASGYTFQFYKKGVYGGPCEAQLNHGVTVVGYGMDRRNEYWIVKNSWGNDWGEDGYVRMKRDVDDGGGGYDGEGLCGIASLASYPVV